jgi:ferredoxin
MTGQDVIGKVTIDSGMCTGHGRCYELEPDRFEPDDEGYGQVVQGTVTAEDRLAVRRVVDLCPEQAVRLEELLGDD